MLCIIRMSRILPRLVPFRWYSKKKGKGGCSEIPEEVMEEMEKGFLNLCYSDSKSLLKKYLTRDIFDRLKTKTTPTFNSTLLDCIRSGISNYNSNVGIYAPDPEAYATFAEIFDPIIEEYHGFEKTDKHPASCFGYGSDFPDLDPERKYIVSTRVRCGRSIKNFPFNPCLTKCDYHQLQAMTVKALENLCGEHSGKYFPLGQMKEDTKTKLIEKHYLFKEDDPFLNQANGLNFWPMGRGIFINRARTFLVWVNEEDHIRVISMEKGGDLGRVYERMIIGVESLAHQLKFSHDHRLGFLTFCPTNLGSSVRASVHMRLPNIGNNRVTFEDITNKYNLQVRGTHGEHTATVGGVYDISNKRRMGLTEYETITEMYQGIHALIDAECERAAEKKRQMDERAKLSTPKKDVKEEQKKIQKQLVDKCKPKQKSETDQKKPDNEKIIPKTEADKKKLSAEKTKPKMEANKTKPSAEKTKPKTEADKKKPNAVKTEPKKQNVDKCKPKKKPEADKKKSCNAKTKPNMKKENVDKCKSKNIKPEDKKPCNAKPKPNKK